MILSIFSATRVPHSVPCMLSLQVYFLWICPSHKHFEWFIDVLRDVERKDVTNVLEIHIFITQFFHKFDLRTTMLVSGARAVPSRRVIRPYLEFVF